MPAKVATAQRFEGFADPSRKFWKQLAKRQDKAFYEAHKAEHKEGWEAPMRALLSEMRGALDGAYPDCDIGEPKIFRIHRDVRFSKDKSPYKTNVSGCLFVAIGPSKATETPAPLYLQVGTETMAGAGLYMMDAPQLAAYRAAVLDPKRGPELAKIVAKLLKDGFVLESAEVLKKVPRGIDPDHPRADLLRRKGLVAMFPPFDEALLGSRALVKTLTEHGKKAALLVRFLTHEVMIGQRG